MKKTINPEPGALKALASSISPDEPITMINLLKFNQRADYQTDDKDKTECSGRAAYATYSKYAFKFVEGVGGKVVFHGKIKGLVISPDEDLWDEALLVNYPSFDAFKKMIMNPNYQAITQHRTAALSDSRLWLTQSE